MIINHNITSRNIVRAVSLLITWTGFFVACAQIEENDPGKGYLSFGSLSIDAKVEGLQLTKASVPATEIPTADQFTYTIINKEDGLTYYENVGLPVEVIPLPIGPYKVQVSYGANEFGRPYYFASNDNVTIKEDETTALNFSKIPLANAMVAVTLPDMTGHMSVSSISLSLSDGSSIPVKSGEYNFAPSGKEVFASFAGKNALGEDKSVKLSLGTLQPQRAYDVKFTLELPQLTFANQSSGAIAGRLYLTSLAGGEGLDQSKIAYQLSSDGGSNWSSVTPEDKSGYWLISGLTATQTYKIRAVYGGITTEPWEFIPATPSPVISFSIEHDYQSNVLTGSIVKVGGQNVSYGDILNGLITERGVQVKNPSGTVVRTIKRNETGSISETTEGWPYLPQGSYTLEAYFKIGEETVVYNTWSADSPAPQFSVTAYAETSYSRYTSTDAALKAKANDAGTGDKVMEIQGKVSISDAILGNPNYLNLINATLTYDGISMLSDDYSVTSSTFRPNTLVGHTGLFDDENDNVINQDWGSHTVAASFTFDGVSANGEVPCHVTGIPYNISFQDNIRPAEWTLSNNGSSYSRLVLKRGEAYALTPTFIIPGDIYAEAILQAYAYRGSVGKYSPTVAIHISDTGTNATTDATLSGVSDLPYTATYYDVKSDLNFTTSSKVCIYTSGNGSDWSVGSGDMGVVCQSFVINYK